MRTIIASVAMTTKKENKIWKVSITGEDQSEKFCKNARTAMRLCWLLHSRHGVVISEYCLKRLSQEIAEEKARQMEDDAAGREKLEAIAQQFIESHSVDNVLARQTEPEASAEPVPQKPLRTRRTRSKKQESTATALA